MSRAFSAAVALAVLSTLGVENAGADFSDFRATFINRFEYSTSATTGPADIQNKMAQLKDLGLTDVMFQVRGRADAYYNSQFETRAEALGSSTWDPLQTAIDAAHANGLKLHAWINAMPIWNSATLPTNPNHVFYKTNPSYRVQYLDGSLQPAAGIGGYSIANFVIPEVQQHLNYVVGDLASHYNLDGVHLDYIRNVSGVDFNVQPHDPQSHAMFFAATGLDGANPANKDAYLEFVKGRLTTLVASLKHTVDSAEVATGRTMQLTASVWRDPDVGEHDYLQDYRTWLEQDLLDVAMPMIYLSSSNDSLFNPNLLNTLNIPTHAKVAPTLGVYLHTATGGGVALTVSEMQRAYNFGADGIGFYGYSALFNDSLSADRRTAIKNFFAAIESAPQGGPGNVLDDFETDEGHFNWAYNQSPVSQTFGLSPATTIDRVTGSAHRGAACQELELVASGAGNWQVRHNSGIGQVANPSGNAPLLPTGSVGFWLKTDHAGITAQIAIDDPAGPTSTALERSVALAVTADNLWHLYQWDLDDAALWDAFAGGADGDIDGFLGTVSIDSIWLAGAGSANVFLDTVSHNPNGPLDVPEPDAAWLALGLLAGLLLLATLERRRLARPGTVPLWRSPRS